MGLILGRDKTSGIFYDRVGPKIGYAVRPGLIHFSNGECSGILKESLTCYPYSMRSLLPSSRSLHTLQCVTSEVVGRAVWVRDA